MQSVWPLEKSTKLIQIQKEGVAMRMSRHVKRFGVALAVAIVASTALAIDTYWSNHAYDNDPWTTTAGWSAGVPSAVDNARISAQTTPTAENVSISIASGIDAVASGVWLGFGSGTATLNMDGGTLTTGYLQFGHTWNYNGILNLSGGQIDVNGNLRVGFRHVSDLNISGGNLEVDSIYFGATGADFSLTGGSLTLTASDVTAENWSASQIAKTTFDFGDAATSSGKFIANFDWWDAAELDQTVEAQQLYNRMKSTVDGVDKFGSEGVRWYYDSGNTVFEAIPEPGTLGLMGSCIGGLLLLRKFYR